MSADTLSPVAGGPFDFTAALAPLPGDTLVGPSLRYDPVYDAIREARRQDDPSLPVGVWQTTAKRADWDLAIRLCREVLDQRSKDIQIACWLTEALVHRHGFSALGPSIRLLADLCDAFWDEGLHPEIDEAEGGGDVGARVAPLEWLNDKLPTWLQTLPLTRSGGQPPIGYSFADYENAQRHQLAAVRDPRGVVAALARSGGPTLAEIEASAQATAVTFHHAQHDRLAEALVAIDALSTVLDDHCGRQAPGLVGLREGCVALQGWVDTMLRAKGEEPEMTQATSVESATADGMDPDLAPDPAPQDEPVYGAGPIQTREEAYFWLAEAADFLLRSEPHSPTPYLIHRALGWANMPLHEVLLEVSRGRNDLSAVFDFLGFNFTEMSQQNGGKSGK